MSSEADKGQSPRPEVLANRLDLADGSSVYERVRTFGSGVAQSHESDPGEGKEALHGGGAERLLIRRQVLEVMDLPRSWSTRRRRAALRQDGNR